MPVGWGDGVESVGVRGRKKEGDCNNFTLSRVHGVSCSSNGNTGNIGVRDNRVHQSIAER